jgi:hypothetical protein
MSRRKPVTVLRQGLTIISQGMVAYRTENGTKVRPLLMTDYLAVPYLDTLAVYSVQQLMSTESLARAAVFANRLEQRESDRRRQLSQPAKTSANANIYAGKTARTSARYL